MATNTFDIDAAEYISLGAKRWDARAVTATSFPINTARITQFIDSACGELCDDIYAKGIDPTTITLLDAPDAYNRAREAVFLMVEYACLLNIAGLDAEVMRGERDRAINRLKSIIHPSMGESHHRNTEDRVDAGGHGY